MRKDRFFSKVLLTISILAIAACSPAFASPPTVGPFEVIQASSHQPEVALMLPAEVASVINDESISELAADTHGSTPAAVGERLPDATAEAAHTVRLMSMAMSTALSPPFVTEIVGLSQGSPSAG